VLPDRWESAAPPPVALDSAAGGIIGGRVYLVGAGGPATLAYDLATDSWSAADALAARPFPGPAPAAEVFGGRLYLFGGQGQGSVQIYDPASDRWSLGAALPFAAESTTATRIGDQIYVAGGALNGQPIRMAARYDPQADAWGAIAALPLAVSQSAAGTDGDRLYLFGGNDAGGPIAGVQIYDPQSDTWTSGAAAGATGAEMPLPRSTMGRAIYANGEFYLIGGSERAGAAAAISGRVDIFSPTQQSWRSGRAMPSPRQGGFPLLIADRIYMAGGAQAGAAPTPILDIYNIAAPRAKPGGPGAIWQLFLPIAANSALASGQR
jgi:N-acetylneuraminic acid mutarotase